ncbi:MAG: class I SAM-dependent methyltransferase [Blautia sp.]
MNESLQQLVLSKARTSDGPSKVKIRPVKIKDKICFQAAVTMGTKELHENFSAGEAVDYIETSLKDQFMQLQLSGRCRDGVILISKKGKVTVKTKNHPCREAAASLDHNRKKRYILREGKAVPFLVDLGVMTGDGRIVASKYDKFRQVNRFLEFIEDILPRLSKKSQVTILDFGCGKSYLTFAMYYYLRELQGYDVHIIGLDLKADVIETCSRLAEKYGYENLHFYQGDIADYEGVSQVDMVVTLHACDTATDFALAKAVGWNAKVILSVPCCQHELNGQIQNELLEPVFSYGILKERMAALLTDGIRAQLLESCGYETQILEFIDMEHTPKNLLIRAVYTGKKKDRDKLDACIRAFGAAPTLDRLLSQKERKQ